MLFVIPYIKDHAANVSPSWLLRIFVFPEAIGNFLPLASVIPLHLNLLPNTLSLNQFLLIYLQMIAHFFFWSLKYITSGVHTFGQSLHELDLSITPISFDEGSQSFRRLNTLIKTTTWVTPLGREKYENWQLSPISAFLLPVILQRNEPKC